MNALIVETDSATCHLLRRLLREAGYDVFFCEAAAEARTLIAARSPRFVFLNCDGPGDAAFELCQWIRSDSQANQTWVIGLSRCADSHLPVRALSSGADDLLLKPIAELSARMCLLVAQKHRRRLLNRAEERQIQRNESDNRAQEQAAISALGQCALARVDLGTLIGQALAFVSQILETEFCALFELAPDRCQLVMIDSSGWPDEWRSRLSVSAEPRTAEGQTLRDEPVMVADWRQEPRLQIPAWARESGIRSTLSVIVPGPSAPFGVLAVYATTPKRFSEDEVRFLKSVAIVLSLAIERDRSEMAIQRLATFPRFNPNPVLEFSSASELTYANQAAEEITRAAGLDSVLELLPIEYSNLIQQCFASGQSVLHLQKNIGKRTFSWSFFPICETRTIHCYGEDVTGRMSLEKQFRQLQKMECVGRLAAGLAHDFNNVLTIIRGHADLVLSDNALSDKKTASLTKIVAAADRATHLTRQLLTFSRRQVSELTALNLSECVKNFTKMLDRVLGEDIELTCEFWTGLPAVPGDAGMLDQVVMNLAVNARDAMPNGGRLIIATSVVDVDEDHVRRRPDARAGRFVCLAVTDTGCGMDEETLAQVFEPFFTTKAAGQGTGLGLATVYGIVQQHKGWIEVVSQVNRGTTFLIFLPCSGQTAINASAEGNVEFIRAGTETILLVEDEPTLRELARMNLQNAGYKTIEAGSGAEAVEIWEREKSDIDLLLTDIVMPGGVSGIELAKKVQAEKPGLKIIYTSGYGREMIDPTDALPFLQKPFTTQKLAQVVRDTLDATAATVALHSPRDLAVNE